MGTIQVPRNRADTGMGTIRVPRNRADTGSIHPRIPGKSTDTGIPVPIPAGSNRLPKYPKKPLDFICHLRKTLIKRTQH